jgi:hypothetical protein
MTQQADKRTNGREPDREQAVPVSSQALNALNRMRTVCGIVGRVALRSIEEREEAAVAQDRSPRKTATGKSKDGARSTNRYQEQLANELSVEELFAEAIATLGLSKDEVIDLWDLFLAASAGAKKHYRDLVQEQHKQQASKGDISSPGPAVHVAVPYESQ